jgi:hypothetical protein
VNVAQVEWAQVRYETSRRRGKRGETLFSWVWVFFHFNLVVNPYDGPRRIKWKVFFYYFFFLNNLASDFGFNFVSYPVVFCTTSVNSWRGGGWVKEKNVGRKQWRKRLSLFCPFPLFGFLTASAWFNWTVVGRHSGSILCSYLSSYFVAVVHTVVTMFLFLFLAPAPASVASDCWTSLSPSLYPCLVLSSSDTRRTQKMRKWKGRAPEMKCLGRGRRWNSGRLACWEERMLRSIDFFFSLSPSTPSMSDGLLKQGIKKKILSHQTVSFGDGGASWNGSCCKGWRLSSFLSLTCTRFNLVIISPRLFSPFYDVD